MSGITAELKTAFDRGAGGAAGAAAEAEVEPTYSRKANDDFVEAVHQFVSRVRTVAFPELLRRVADLQSDVYDQVTDLNGSNAGFDKVKEELARKKQRAEAVDVAMRVTKAQMANLVGSKKMAGGVGPHAMAGGRGGVGPHAMAGGRGGRGAVVVGTAAGSGKSGSAKGNPRTSPQYNRLLEQSVKQETEKKRLAEEVKQLEVRIERIRGQFSETPNPKIYESASEQVLEAARAYVNAVRREGNVVMKARTDGPKKRVENEVYDAARATLRELFEGLDARLREALTSAAPGAGAPATVTLFDTAVAVDVESIGRLVAAEQGRRTTVLRRVDARRTETVRVVLEMVGDAHEEALGIAQPVDIWSAVSRKDITVLYALKGVRVLLLFAATTVSTRMFENVYAESMASKDPVPPDLKFYVVMFMAFNVLFDGVLLGALLLLSKLLPLAVDTAVIKDLAVDTAVCHTMVGISLVPMADIIQDKRYFEYKSSSPRAMRLMKQMSMALGGLHALVPYFFLTGPFYTQYRSNI
jgi:hypothetical protein